MSPPKARPSQDKSYSRKQLSALYRQARRDSDGRSPEALDQRILALAEREAVPKQRYWPGYRLGMVATACILCISLLVVLRTPESQLEPATSPEFLRTPKQLQESTNKPAATAAEAVSPAPQALEEAAFAPAPPATDNDVAPLSSGRSLPKKDNSRQISTSAASRSLEQGNASDAAGAAFSVNDRIQIIGSDTAQIAAPKQPTPQPSLSGQLEEVVISPSASAWLEEIARLLDSNKPEQARAEFDAFRQRYPDHPVDHALRQRLTNSNHDQP